MAIQLDGRNQQRTHQIRRSQLRSLWNDMPANAIPKQVRVEQKTGRLRV